MTITTTDVFRTIMGNKHVVVLKCVDSGAGSVDEVATGLSRVEIVIPLTKNDANTPAINESYPLEGGDLTITADATSDEFYLIVFGLG